MKTGILSDFQLRTLIAAEIKAGTYDERFVKERIETGHKVRISLTQWYRALGDLAK